MNIDKIKEKALKIYHYCTVGVWSDLHDNRRVSIVKILNLTVRSVINPNFQNLAAAMTYRTVLALVPVLALIFAIMRGFGFQNLMTTQLDNFFPSQRRAIDTAMQFVDSYLNQASEGVFVGVGIVFLLWTVISLLSNLEDSFNSIWQVKVNRTLWRKATDYLGIFIILPILIICSNGITIVLDTTLKRFLPEDFLTPALSFMFECVSFVLTCLFFASAYMLIPNAKVKFKNAIISGSLAALAYTILQWMFVSGQMYVAKYNAIYGSFSFLPLLLIWLQLVWLFTFVGAEICYASQNFARFNFQTHISRISLSYRLRVDVALMAIIARRFTTGKRALNTTELSELSGIPQLLVETAVEKLLRAGVLTYVIGPDADKIDDDEPPAVAPVREVATMTLGNILTALYDRGSNDFIPDFKERFAGVEKIMNSITDAMIEAADATPLSAIEINLNNLKDDDDDTPHDSPAQ